MIRNCTFAIGSAVGTVEVIGTKNFHLPQNLPSLQGLKSCEVLSPKIQVLATLNLPKYLLESSFVITNESELLIIGGRFWYGRYWPQAFGPIESNLVFRGTKWINHSVLIQPRSRPISICMPNGIYVFGGQEITSEGTYQAEKDYLFSSEFLPNGTLTWQNGPKFPKRADFVHGGHGVAISETELVMMGGFKITRQEYDEKKGKHIHYGYPSKQIWKFNTITEKWHRIGKMKLARCYHKAIYLNGKVIVSGGWTQPNFTMNSSEIFDPHNTDIEPILVGNLNVSRYMHGMGTILKNGTHKIIVFGGYGGSGNPQFLESIEEWDPEKRKWTLLKEKLYHGREV